MSRCPGQPTDEDSIFLLPVPLLSIDQITLITTAALLVLLSKVRPGAWALPLPAMSLGPMQGRWPNWMKANAFLSRAGPKHMTSVLGPRAVLDS